MVSRIRVYTPYWRQAWCLLTLLASGMVSTHLIGVRHGVQDGLVHIILILRHIIAPRTLLSDVGVCVQLEGGEGREHVRGVLGTKKKMKKM